MMHEMDDDDDMDDSGQAGRRVVIPFKHGACAWEKVVKLSIVVYFCNWFFFFFAFRLFGCCFVS